MKKNKVALFDIDYTIFNAAVYRNFFQDALLNEFNVNLTKEQFSSLADQAYHESKKEVGYFDPQSLIILLSKKLNKTVDIPALTKIVLDDNLIQKSLYEESIDVFRELSKEKNLTLGIFSGGRIDLQRSKIKSIEEFLHKEHIHIFEFEKWTALPVLLEKYSSNSLYIIDDLLSVLSAAKKLYNATTTIWIKRGLYQDKLVQGFSPDFTIQNLKEVVGILKN